MTSFKIPKKEAMLHLRSAALSLYNDCMVSYYNQNSDFHYKEVRNSLCKVEAAIEVFYGAFPDAKKWHEGDECSRCGELAEELRSIPANPDEDEPICEDCHRKSMPKDYEPAGPDFDDLPMWEVQIP